MYIYIYQYVYIDIYIIKYIYYIVIKSTKSIPLPIWSLNEDFLEPSHLYPSLRGHHLFLLFRPGD